MFLQEMAVERKRLYTELSRRIEREKQLKIVEEKLSVNKLLLVS